MALHPDMVLKSRTAKGISDALAEATEVTFHTCRICLNEAEDPIVSKCRHIYCRECVRTYIEAEEGSDCVVCHLPLTIDLEQPAIDEVETGAVKTRQGMLEKVDPSKWRTSTKIEALVEELSRLRSEDSTQKALVFSQFTSFRMPSVLFVRNWLTRTQLTLSPVVSSLLASSWFACRVA
jgi:DNA repair protein RAD16